MNKKFILPAFALMIALQWFVPGKMIFDKESVITSGKTYKFRMAPVDPNDPFRGKYITLRYSDVTYTYPESETWDNDNLVYVSLKTDAAGYAGIKKISNIPPTETDYVTAYILQVMHYEHQLMIQYPFDRYYVEESKASEIEKKFQDVFQDTTRTAYAVVAVKNGDAVVRSLEIE